MIAELYRKSKENPAILEHVDTVTVSSLEELDSLQADKKMLLAENDQDEKIFLELEKQGRIKDETTMRPGFDRE